MKGNQHVLMEATPGTSGGGAAPAAGTTAAAADGGAAGTPAANTGAPGTTAGGTQPAAGSTSAAPGSAIAAGSAAAGTPASGSDPAAAEAAKPWSFIPEKYQVKNDKGELDSEASARKVAEAHSALEKRMGEGSVRPKTAAEYKMPELPEALKDMPVDDAATAKFKEEAHKAGYSQSQFEFAMSKYFELAPGLVNAGQKFTTEDTISSLKEVWGADYQKNAHSAWSGITKVAELAGLSIDEVEKEVGNSPVFNRIMAAVGQQFREDTSVNTNGNGAGTADLNEAATIQMSPAFRNTKDPGHAAAVQRWNAIVTKGVPNTPMLA